MWSTSIIGPNVGPITTRGGDGVNKTAWKVVFWALHIIYIAGCTVMYTFMAVVAALFVYLAVNEYTRVFIAAGAVVGAFALLFGFFMLHDIAKDKSK
jgi:uncharacterized membrane protein YagU involved in acid resistance